jgi:hypothetical protein
MDGPTVLASFWAKLTHRSLAEARPRSGRRLRPQRGVRDLRRLGSEDHAARSAPPAAARRRQSRQSGATALPTLGEYQKGLRTMRASGKAF